MDKEKIWLKQRCGYITASMLSDIVSKSGRITKMNTGAIRSKRFERKHGFCLPVSARPMEIGKANEPYAVAWFREHFPDIPIIYSQELPEIPFWSVDWAKFGASPDAFTEDKSHIVEFKTVVSNTNVEFFADECTSYEEKKAKVWEEHGDQLLGQFLASPSTEIITLVKHIPQDDLNDEDLDSPLADWRGSIYVFNRRDFEGSLRLMKDRIILIDKMIDSVINPSEFESGNWKIDENGQLHVSG